MTLFEIGFQFTNGSFLPILWLILVAVLWIGFFFLEGFDFGVGMLVPFLGKNDQGRRVVINTVGPHWDGNEVWLLTAGGAMFAAFPGWYAALFSGLYLPLFLVLLGLIVRGVAFEYRSKRDEPAWRNAWDWAIAIGSFIPALVFGVGFANFLKGLAVSTWQTDIFGPVTGYAGGFLNLFSPFALIGGVLFVVLFLAHGAFFVALKTRDEIHDRAQKLGSTLALVGVVVMLVFVVAGNARWFPNWFVDETNMGALPGHPGWLSIAGWVAGVLAVVALAFAWFMNSKKRDGFAFLGSALSTVLLVAMFFTHFYPGLGFNNSAVADAPIDLSTASSSIETLTIMSWVALFLVPVVLAYTVWSYFFVFRRRLNTTNIPALDVVTAA